LEPQTTTSRSLSETLPPPEDPRGDGRPLGPSQLRGTSVSLWAGAIGAPSIWAVQLFVLYALVPWACHTRKLWVLHASTAVFLLMTAVCLVLCVFEWNRIGRGWPRGAVGGETERRRFLSM